MKSPRFTLLCLFAGLGLTPFGGAIDEAACRKALHAMTSNGLYTPFDCCGNIKRLIEELKKTDPNLQGNVIFFVGEKYRGMDVPIERIAFLSPQDAPHARGQNWPTHVVFSLDGKIYDADGSQHEPLNPTDYIGKMFPKSRVHPDGNLENHLLVRSIPTALFLAEVESLGIDRTVEKYAGTRDKAGLNGPQVRQWIDSLNANAPSYPVITFQELTSPPSSP